MAEFDPNKPLDAPTFDPNKPLDDLRASPEDEGVLTELGEGLASGVISALGGVAELVGSGIDLMADTNYSSNATRNTQRLKDALGLDPVGFVGKGAEVITQFVVPGLGAAGLVSKASKLGKLQRSGAELTRAQRFALGAEQTAAAVGADIMVANDGVTTIGDFFEGGPTQTDQEVGLTGREEAIRRLSNKFMVGAETGALVATAPFALAGAGSALAKTGDVVGTAVSPFLSPMARGIKESRVVNATRDYLDEIENVRRMDETQSPLRNGVADMLGALRYRGLLPQRVAEKRADIIGIGEGEIKEAQNTLNELNSVIDDITKNNSNFTRTQILNNVEAYLDPLSVGKNVEKAQKEALDNLPTSVQPIVKKMRGHIDGLSKDILDSDLMRRLSQEGNIPSKKAKETVGETLSKTIEKNLNTYLRRKFLVQSDPNYVISKESMEEAITAFMKKENEGDTLRLLKALHEELPNIETKAKLGLNEAGDGFANNVVSREQATKAAEKFIKDQKKKYTGAETEGRIAIDRIRAGMFIDRKRMPMYQRKLLGEVRDPEEAYLNTIADLAEFKAVDNYFGNIRTLADTDSGIGRLFVRPDAQAPEGYVRLGEEGLESIKSVGKSTYGSLEGYQVPKRVYQELTRALRQDTGVIDRTLMATYSGFLRAKGFTQYGKTVLSPITQIRNVTSAALFALAQGNVGRGANLWESIGLVIDDIRKITPEAQLKELQDMQRRGVLGTQAELQEIRRLINEGSAVGTRTVEQGRGVGKVFGEKIARSRGGEFLQSAGQKIAGFGQKAEDFYQGGDNIWKIYNYRFEQSKLRNALNSMDEAARTQFLQRRGFDSAEEFLKDEAARIVRNTVPNYNLAPEVIKSIRKLPIGNFIAFPYEILRTSMNTIGRGLDELASEVPEIQKIGLRRLTGAATTYAAFPAALSAFAHEVSGVSEEEMKAYQRSIAAPWEKNARLIPTGRDQNGLPTYINYSYTNPYDMLERVVNGAINRFQEGQALGKSGAQATSEAAFEGLSELFSPFLEEAIITAKLRDVLPVVAAGRGGQTVTGARVYNPDEALGDQIAKSFTHILDAIIPSAVPVNVSGGEFEAGRFIRSFATATGMNDVLGISPKDKQDRERQLSGELVRAFTGITENEIKADMALKFKGYEFSESRQNTSNIFNRIARRPNLTNSDELLDAYKDANEARFQAFNRFHMVVEDLRTMGMTDREIKRTLRQAGVSGIGKLLRGQYEPLKISGTVRREMRRNGTYDLLPRDEIQEIFQQQRDRKFGEAELQEAPTAPVFNPQAPIDTPAPTQAPTAPVFNPQAPIDTPAFNPQAPVSSAPSQAGNEVSAILVPDPLTRATFGIG
jgi:hypothetical protein